MSPLEFEIRESTVVGPFNKGSMLMGLDTVHLPPFSTKGDYFCEFLFALLHGKPHLKRYVLLKGKHLLTISNS